MGNQSISGRIMQAHCITRPYSTMTRRLLRCLAFGIALLGAISAHGEVITVASSLPKDFLAIYKRAIEAQYPGTRIQYVNFPATHTTSFLRDRAPGNRPDVFWGSAPDIFLMLRRHDLLEFLGKADDPGIPEYIGHLRINDENGYFKGQALSGYGVMWNVRYLKARGIRPPGNWQDLAHAAYFGHVVMSSPSRSSTTHLMIEAILQDKGWQDGWSLILRIAANCGLISERSAGVPSTVSNGRFGAGLVVDFLGLSARHAGNPVAFTYARPTVVSVANIALIKGARNPSGGKRFIDFTLSAAGQALLLHPEIGRLPVRPASYASLKDSETYSQIDDVLAQSIAEYDPEVSETRYRIVGAIFDQLITYRHQELVDLNRLLLQTQQALARHPNPLAEALVEKAQALVFSPPISEKRIPELQKISDTPVDIARLASYEAEWGRLAKTRYTEARLLIEQAQSRIRP